MNTTSDTKPTPESAPTAKSVADMDLDLTAATAEYRQKSPVRQREDIEREIEAEFLQILPSGAWILIEVEPEAQQSEVLIVKGVRSPFSRVISVGPEVRHDIAPGDRIFYAECIGMPKELSDTKWAHKYKWVHENKFMGRLPREVAAGAEKEKTLAVLRPAPAAGGLSEIGLDPATTAAVRKVMDERDGLAAKFGVDPEKGVLGRGSVAVRDPGGST